MSDHDCTTCADCIHNGTRCCGCYDGACCQHESRAWDADERTEPMSQQNALAMARAALNAPEESK